jgi:hypothetical protein
MVWPRVPSLPRSLAAPKKDLGDGTPHTLPSVLSNERVGPATGQTGRAIVAVSPSGQYVSACWPASRQYFVWYRTLTGAWQQVDSGLGVDLAWHSHRWDGFRLPGWGCRSIRRRGA